jgi:hypothetical protein
MKKCIAALLAISVVCIAGCASGIDPEVEKLAVKSAEKWVKLLDNARYARTWEIAAPSFKSNITKEAWVESIQASRGPLGESVSREIRSKRYRTSLSGAPDGEYVTVKFKTSFENKKSAVETVTSMLEENDDWSVCRYSIR